MSLIGLVYRTDYSGIFLLVLLGNLKCVVLGGSVVYNKDLDIIPAGKSDSMAFLIYAAEL